MASLPLFLLLAAEVAGFQPTTKGSIEYALPMCRASRSFRSGGTTITFALERQPFEVGTQMSITFDPAQVPAAPGRSVEVLDGAGAKLDWGVKASVEGEGPRGQIVLGSHGNAFPSLTAARTLTVKRGALVFRDIPLDGLTALSRAMETCERALAEDVRIDPAALARMATPASASRDWLNTVFSRYEIPAYKLWRSDRTDSHLLWRVDTNGKAHDCRVLKVSDQIELDKIVCAAIVKGGSFTPARDSAGNPVDGFLSLRTRWRAGF